MSSFTFDRLLFRKHYQTNQTREKNLANFPRVQPPNSFFHFNPVISTPATNHYRRNFEVSIVHNEAFKMVLSHSRKKLMSKMGPIVNFDKRDQFRQI